MIRVLLWIWIYEYCLSFSIRSGTLSAIVLRRLSPEIDRKRTQAAVEAALEKYRIYNKFASIMNLLVEKEQRKGGDNERN